MATDTLEIFGTEYSGVTGVKATDSNNQTKTYIRPQGTKSISANGSGIDVVNYASVDVDVSVTETDPVFTASAAAGISSTDVSNWDNAYDGNIDFDTTAQSGDDYNLTQILTSLGWLSDVIV